MSARAPAAPRLRGLIERSAQRTAPAASAAAVERCGMCGAPVPDQHRHIADLSHQRLLCACRACVLLFDHRGAGAAGRLWCLIPERCVPLPGLELDDIAWRSLGLPVEMAFFVRDGRSGRVRAFYPSPAGSTECELALDCWQEIETANPALGDMEPDVEALLVNRTGAGGPAAFLTGIDECYRLVAIIRRSWRGFTGGELVWSEIARFFAALRERASGRP
ncbi:MAG TPA: DUF5947 family protein [Solirubrobacteraceae bacterium]|nr:DUF5947 family protein [Solirubrobacteraceae bacterium]